MKRPMIKCFDCKKNCNYKGKSLPMLHDCLWKQICNDQEIHELCRACCEKRLGRKLTSDDAKTDVLMNYLPQWVWAFEDIAPSFDSIKENPEFELKFFNYIKQAFPGLIKEVMGETK